MNKTAVIYQSHYGTTEQYAKWISQELEADIFQSKKTTLEEIKKYNTLIFGGGLYASSILGSKLLSKNFGALKDKNLIVFTVGAAGTDDPSIFEDIIDKNFEKEMRKSIRFFHFRGGQDYKKMSFVHKTMMKMMVTMVKKKPEEEKTQEDRQLIASYGGVIDFSDKNTIEPLVNYAKTL